MTEQLREPEYITGSDGKRRLARRTDTTGRDDQIIRLRNQGRSQRAIAAEVGCAQFTVAAVLKRARAAAEAA